MIYNVTDTPDPAGIGQNVTIQADVIDNDSGVDLVTVDITLPNETIQTFQMSHITGDTYQYVYTGSWLIGQYNYTIQAYDKAQNSNSSMGHSFNITGHANITVATEQDYYLNTSWINITDPPVEPTITLVDRGRMYDTYFNSDTYQYILELSTGPINYLDDIKVWQPIDTTIDNADESFSSRSYGYKMTKADYHVYYRKTSSQNSDRPLVFLVGGYGLSITPDDTLGFDDETSVGSKMDSTADHQDDILTFSNQYGSGIDLRYTCQNIGVKSDLIINSLDALPTPNQDANLIFTEYLRPYEMDGASENRSMGIRYGTDHMVFKEFDTWDSKTVTTEDTIWFIGEHDVVVFLIPELYAYDSDGFHLPLLLEKTLHMTRQGDLWVEIRIPYSWLSDEETKYPVYIDPTVTVNCSSDDGYIYRNGNPYATVHDASTGNIVNGINYLYIGQKAGQTYPNQYHIYRGFLFFNTSVLPDDAVIEQANLSLYITAKEASNEYDVVVQNGQPESPHKPLLSQDFYYTNYSGDGGSLNTIDISVSAYNVIDLTASGRSWINTLDFTKLCLRSSRDVDSQSPGWGQKEYIYCYSGDYGSNPPKMCVVYSNRSQSKITNSGVCNVSGYLCLWIEFNDSGEWVVDRVLENNSFHSINTSVPLSLDLFFNGSVRSNDFNNSDGRYRVYAALCDPDGDVLVMKDEVVLEAWWEFLVDLS